MRICQVAHGTLSIPPAGWGAIEASLADQKFWLERLGHECHIVNTQDARQVVGLVNSLAPDVVQIHYERFFGLCPELQAKVKIIASQWPRLYQPGNEAEARRYLAGDSYVCCVSEEVRRRCLDIGLPAERLLMAKNGARSDLFRLADEPLFPERSIFLGAVNRRKRQYLIKEMGFVDIAGPLRPTQGPLHDKEFDPRHPTYLGEWSKDKVYAHLTDYANLVLLSEAEAAPLVTCEALMAGLGLVVSESAASNLDPHQPFIDIIPEARIHESEHVAQIIRHNQQTAVAMRRAIRQYAVDNFDWRDLVEQYLGKLTVLLEESRRRA